MNLSWAAVRREGFQSCRLGSSRSVVESVLGPPDNRFQRGGSGPVIDHYRALGVQVTYDLDDCVCFVEVASPASPTVEGVPLIGRELDGVCEDLDRLGIEFVEDSAGALLPEWDVGLYVAGTAVEGVSAGSDEDVVRALEDGPG